MSTVTEVILVGIDWADKVHAFEAVDPNGKRQSGTFNQSQADIAQWIDSWHRRFPNARILICVEATRGALINSAIRIVYLAEDFLDPSRREEDEAEFLKFFEYK